jgi:hypothetical protein
LLPVRIEIFYLALSVLEALERLIKRKKKNFKAFFFADIYFEDEVTRDPLRVVEFCCSPEGTVEEYIVRRG